MSSSSTSRPRHTLRWVMMILLVVVAGGVAYHFLANTAETPESSKGMEGPPATAVSAIAATQGDLSIRVSALGTVQPLESIAVRPRVEGELIKVNFTEGETVQEGQLLAQIDPRDYQAQLDQAKGQLAQDQAQLASAREDLSRYEQLSKTNHVSRQELEQQRQLVRQYEGTVASDQASVRSAQVQLDYTNITASTTGVAGIRNVDPGNIVQLGDSDPIVTITQLDPVSVIFSLPSRYVNTVRTHLAAGDQPSVEVTGSDDATFSGKLTSIDSNINSATGTIRLRATFDNPEGRLYPNAYVDVSLVSQILTDQVIIPEPAVQTGQDGNGIYNYVYVIGDDDSVSRRTITLAASQGTQSAISEGLSPGERVVVDGVDSLREGARVRVVSNALPGESSDKESAAGGKDGGAS